MNKLVVALYEDRLITIDSYQEKIHHGKLFCPFCNPTLRITYDKRGYFKAWPNQGGHNCGRGQVKYFDADWKGRSITEIINSENGIEVIIDIKKLVDKNYKAINDIKPKLDNVYPADSKQFAVYKEKKDVFRDVIRNVLQMKKLLEKNDYSQLKNINFSYKTGGYNTLTIDEIVIESYKLTVGHINNNLFIIFVVDDVKLKDYKIYINALSSDGINLSAVFSVSEPTNPYEYLIGNNVIAFGYITYSNQLNKYFINLNNDFQVVLLDKKKSDQLFESKQLQHYNYSNYVNKKIESENLSTNDEVELTPQMSDNNNEITNYKISEEIEEHNYVTIENGKEVEEVYKVPIIDEKKPLKSSNVKKIIKSIIKRFSTK